MSGAATQRTPDAPSRQRISRRQISRRDFLGLCFGAPALLAGCTTTKEVTLDLDGSQSAFGFRVAEFSTDGTNANDVLAEQSAEVSRLIVGDLPDDDGETGPLPTGFRAPGIRIERSRPVVAVGVDGAGNFDVPARSEIGWYRFGPEPGADGSSVLAAHITLNGRDGAFRYLAEFEAGDIVSVDFDDGSARDFEIQALAQYDKDVLPLDRIFDRSGPPRLVLITCGGVFNPQVDSFEDNLIVYAVPL